MARDLSTLEKVQAIRGSASLSHVREYQAGHPDMAEGGIVSEFHFPEVRNAQNVLIEPAEKVVFIARNGQAVERRTAPLWF
jgi:hypothetical protein